jgi:NADPH2:quinone reductase
MSTAHSTSAIVATDFGGPDVLALVDVELAEPGPGEIVLDVRAAGINPIDFKRYSGQGYMGADRSLLPMRLGFEAAGVVSAVGPDADGPAGPIAVGDEVIAYPAYGAYAQRVVIPAAIAVPKPPNVDFALAGGLLLAGATAVHCLAVTDVAQGDVVLIHAAAGGVGVIAVQLAVARGATVIGTASQRNHVALSALGATPVTYGDGLLQRVQALAPDGVDVAIDCVGSEEALQTSLALVADRGRIVTIVAFAGGPELGIKVVGNGPGGDPGTDIRARARLELATLAGQGKLSIPTQSFPLAQAADAHRALIAGHTHGKIVLVP